MFCSCVCYMLLVVFTDVLSCASCSVNSWNYAAFNEVNIDAMVYDAKTLVVLHELTPAGKENYQQFLEDEGSKLLYRAAHPIQWRVNAVIDWLKSIFV